MRSLIILLFFTASSIASFAQVESYINDKDGFTNVREDKSADSKIIGTIQTAELFISEPDRESNWWKIKKVNGISGFVYHDRIVPVSSQTVVIQHFFKEIETANPNNVEFGETSNEQLFIYAEKFPKSFISAFDQTSTELRNILIKELESPIHDLIDLKLIYTRISNINNYEVTRAEILNAFKKAGENLGIKVSE